MVRRERRDLDAAVRTEHTIRIVPQARNEISTDKQRPTAATGERIIPRHPAADTTLAIRSQVRMTRIVPAGEP